MTEAALVPAWASLIVAALVLIGAVITFIGALGLVRLPNFYSRAHAPTLGATLGAGSILVASMLYFTVAQGRPSLHEILIAVFLTITTPLTLVMLARATDYRDRVEKPSRTGGRGDEAN
jgi:multicomponent K+:H+ antiporter subunit G